LARINHEELELIDKVKNIVSGIYLMPSFGRYNMIIDIITQSGLTERGVFVSPVKV